MIKLEGYKIIKKIGSGGMGDVYLAEHEVLETTVAIKSLHANLVTDESFKKRFRTEAKVHAKLDHPNVVKLIDFQERKDGLFIVMEYVEGKQLDDYIHNDSGPIPEKELLPLFAQIVDAISHAHEKGLAHRDIKPANVIISNGKIKVLDFGIAKEASAESGLTKTGVQVGTPMYMSPEQVNGEKVDKLTDIYSLGVTLFYMAVGKPPYENSNAIKMGIKIISEPFPTAKEFYPGVSNKIEAIIKKATQKNKKDRYQSCEEFKKDLELPLEKISRIETAKSKKRTRKPAIVLGYILLLLFLLGFVSLLMNSRDNSKPDRPLDLKPIDSSSATISEELNSENIDQPLLVNDEYKSDQDCYILNVSAEKTEASARKKVRTLKNDGYKSGFLWIPNFSSLSGAKFYSVFIGPFATQLECELATESYRKIDNKAYGLLVSKKPERVEIRGLDKVKKWDENGQLVLNKYYKTLAEQNIEKEKEDAKRAEAFENKKEEENIKLKLEEIKERLAKEKAEQEKNSLMDFLNLSHLYFDNISLTLNSTGRHFLTNLLRNNYTGVQDVSDVTNNFSDIEILIVDRKYIVLISVEDYDNYYCDIYNALYGSFIFQAKKLDSKTRCVSWSYSKSKNVLCSDQEVGFKYRKNYFKISQFEYYSSFKKFSSYSPFVDDLSDVPIYKWE